MSSVNTVDQVCKYFGGAYDAATHTYRTPQLAVSGLDGPIVRRSPPRSDDHNTDYHQTGATPGSMGCSMQVQMLRGQEKRVAVAGAVSGLKHVSWTVNLHSFVRSTTGFVEDLADVMYALLDAIRTHIEADRTLGTGGFEAGYGVGLQAGEGGDPWLRWEGPFMESTPKGLSKGYLLVEFDCDQYIQA